MAINTFGTLKTAVDNWLQRTDLSSRVPEFIALAEDRIAKDLRVRAMETNTTLIVKATTAGGTAGGTANVITVTPDEALTSYVVGDTVSFTAAATNTSTATVNVSGLGAKDLKRREGNGTRGLDANDIIIGLSYRIYYDGTQFLLIPQGAVPLPERYVAMRRVYVEATRKRLDYFPPAQYWTRNAVNESSVPEIFTIEGDYLILAPVPSSTLGIRLNFYRRFPALSADSDQNWLLAYARGLLLYGALLEAAPFLENDLRTLVWAQMYESLLESAKTADQRDRWPDSGLTMVSDVSVV